LDPKNATQNISINSIDGREMRQIMRAFDIYKRKFAKNASKMNIDLPEPLDSATTSDKVVGGEVTITRYVSFIC
jgi:hypothetical protein